MTDRPEHSHAPRIVLFDLDETLYPAQAGMFREVGDRIHAYIRRHLGLSLEEARALRRRYYQRYGTTLRGLQLHHQIDTEEYLAFVHDFDVAAYVHPNPRLDAALSRLKAEKVLFTNATEEYGRRVLRTLGVEHHFKQVYDIRAIQFYCKPDPRGFDLVLQALPARGDECLLIDDNPLNLRTGKDLGMRTILVGEKTEDGGADAVAEDIVQAIALACQLG